MPNPPGPPGKFRLVARAAVIVLALLVFLVCLGGGWLALWLTASGRARRQAWLGRCALALFRRLGATFIKLGQIMSTRPDLLPEHVTRALERLQDDVGAFPFDVARRTIEEDLGTPIARVFGEIAPVPLATASVAQVYKARLLDGRVIAVKVRRPGVVELCAFDLAVMHKAARVLSWWPPLRSVDTAGAVAEFGSALAQQLDFRIEADNNRRFRHNFRNQDDIVFPEVFTAYSSERVLVMSYLDGTKILSVRSTRHDPRRIARMGLGAMMKMIFEDGFVHADLHPGNMFVTTDGRLAMFDLGLVGQLDDRHRRAFVRFFQCWAQRDGDGMARLMYELSSRGESGDGDGEEDFECFRASVIEFVGRYWGQRIGEVQLGRVLHDLLGILRRHRIRMKPVFTTVNIAIAVTEGIGKQLDPELDLMSEALPFLMKHQVA